jgi:hypothetical protein
MPERKGHKTESDVEAEAHESRSRAAEGEDDGTYVGRQVLMMPSMPGNRC